MLLWTLVQACGFRRIRRKRLDDGLCNQTFIQDTNFYVLCFDEFLTNKVNYALPIKLFNFLFSVSQLGRQLFDMLLFCHISNYVV